MRNIWAIARRELYAYFSSPIAYITMAAFLAVQGIIFLIVLLLVREAAMGVVLGNVFTLLFLILYAAVVTMRLLAEEQRSGTIELVLTAPVRDWELVVGKYLAGVILFLATVLVACSGGDDEEQGSDAVDTEVASGSDVGRGVLAGRTPTNGR